MVQRGIPLNAVKEILGHSSLTTTMRYAHLAPGNLRDAVRVLDGKAEITPITTHGTTQQQIDKKKARG
jgi:integrase